MTRRIVAAGAFLVALFGLPSLAWAHANLVHCSIRNNRTFRSGHAPKSISATFAEDLDPRSSWMAVFEGQADHGLVTEKQHSAVNFKNSKEMTLKLPSLSKEKYYLIWYTRSAVDGHDAAGIVYFSVK